MSSADICCCSLKVNSSEKEFLSGQKTKAHKKPCCCAKSKKCHVKKAEQATHKCKKCIKKNAISEQPLTDTNSSSCQCDRDIQNQSAIILITNILEFTQLHSIDVIYQEDQYFIDPQAIFYPPKKIA